MKSNCVLLLVIGVFAKIYLPDDPRVVFEVQAETTMGEKDNPLVGISAKKSKNQTDESSSQHS